MKKAFLAITLFFAITASAQLEKKDLMVGLNFGFSDILVGTINSAYGFSTTSSIPLGLNVQQMLSDRISLGVHFNFGGADYSYYDGFSSFSGNVTTTSTNLYGIYHYVNKAHFSLGSGLSLGYVTGEIAVDNISVGDNAIKFDVVLADAKYIFKEHFGLSTNIYLLDGFNTIGSFGAFWRF